MRESAFQLVPGESDINLRQYKLMGPDVLEWYIFEKTNERPGLAQVRGDKEKIHVMNNSVENVIHEQMVWYDDGRSVNAHDDIQVELLLWLLPRVSPHYAKGAEMLASIEKVTRG